jgi:hypothetical protein
MNIKKLLAYLVVYIVIIVSVPVFINSYWLKDLPDLNHYEGELEFSGKRAFEDLKYLVENYPDRMVGSENARESAQWIGKKFEEIGLETNYEEFESQALIMGMIEPTIDSKVNGINVIGISKGKSEEVVLVGAHRDTIVIGGDDGEGHEGAQDNASGTVAMLELARVLTSREHYWTYVFVSFDGEEVGLKGSEYFAEKHNSLPIKLALVLDCVGYKDADAIGLYQFEGAKGASPLWTTALAQSIMTSKDLSVYFLDEDGGFDSLGLGLKYDLFGRLMSKRVAGDTNTDSGPFVAKNIPSIGLIAAKEGEKVDPEEVFHSYSDTMEYASAETIEMIGEFAEQYIYSIDLNSFKGDLNSTNYIVQGRRYLGMAPVTGFAFFIFFTVILLWLISSTDMFKNFGAFIRFLSRELKWIISMLLVSVASGYYMLILKMNTEYEINLPLFFLIWFLINFTGSVLILALRIMLSGKKGDNYHKTTANQRILLNTLYTIVFIGTTLYFNAFIAMVLLFMPILIMGRVGYKNVGVRVVWGIIFLIWSVIQWFVLLICFQPYLYEFPSYDGSVMIFINSFIVGITLLYTVSTPLISKEKQHTDWSEANGHTKQNIQSF